MNEKQEIKLCICGQETMKDKDICHDCWSMRIHFAAFALCGLISNGLNHSDVEKKAMDHADNLLIEVHKPTEK